MLTSLDRFRLTNPKEFLDNLNPQAKYKFYERMWKQARNALEELKLIAKNLPERYRERAFNSDTIIPFLESVLEPRNEKEKKPKRKEKHYTQNDRLYDLSMDIAIKACRNADLLLTTSKYTSIRALLDGTLSNLLRFPSPERIQILMLIHQLIKHPERL